MHYAPTGPGDSDKCPDKKQKKGFVCDDSVANRPCIMGGRCDGKTNKCPPLKQAPTGTPCNKDGLFWVRNMVGAQSWASGQ